VIAFASWCVACIDEMPRTMADYAKYKDRVNFLGIDYMDARDAGDATIKKFAIAFPVAREGAPAAEAASSPASAESMRHVFALPGVTPKQLPGLLPELKGALSPDDYAKIAAVAAQCASLSDAACVAYAATKDVTIGGPAPTPAPASPTDVSLPTTFVLDANGVVVKKLEGYDTTTDDLAPLLDKLLK
jgi:thiol-disulfide isomerase/thioredoxin